MFIPFFTLYQNECKVVLLTSNYTSSFLFITKVIFIPNSFLLFQGNLVLIYASMCFYTFV